MPSIRVGTHTIHYREAASATTQRTAVFVHAFLTDSRYWLDQLQGLHDLRRCIALDQLGFGQSDPLIVDRIEPEVYAGQLLDFIDALGLDEPVDLVGFSGGAIVAAVVAERAADRISSLVLSSSAFTTGPDEPYRRYQQEMARLVIVEGKDALFRRFSEYIFGHSPSLIARARYKTMLEAASYEMFVAMLTGQTLAARPDLPTRIRCPVLLPVGEEDAVVSAAHAEELARLFPHATVARIPASGRLLALENPAAFNDAIRRFWSADE